MEYFLGCDHSIHLLIVQNPLHTIENDAFAGLESLTSLNLQNMSLTLLYQCSFCSIHSLEELDISGNSIAVFPETMFKITG